METIAWDYEEGPDYYHIYAFDGPLDGNLDAIAISAPCLPEIDEEVQKIVGCLENIARIIVANESKSGE